MNKADSSKASAEKATAREAKEREAKEREASSDVLTDVLAWADADSFVPLVFHGALASSPLDLWVEPFLRKTLGAGPGAVAPNQADLLVVVGTISQKAAPVLQRVFSAMADPRVVLHIGAPPPEETLRSYAVIQSLQEVIPVDVVLVGIHPTQVHIRACMEALRKSAAHWRRRTSTTYLQDDSRDSDRDGDDVSPPTIEGTI